MNGEEEQNENAAARDLLRHRYAPAHFIFREQRSDVSNHSSGGWGRDTGHTHEQHLAPTKSFYSSIKIYSKQTTPCPESTSVLCRQTTAAYRRSYCQHFADRGYRVVSVTDADGRNLGFLDRSQYYFF
jgi:hypothetical protein